MKPSEVVQMVNLALKTNRPIFLWGPPGIGKSNLIKQVANDTNRLLIDVRAVLLDPVDLRGIPSIEDGRTRWFPPSFLPDKSDQEIILFLDELAQSPPLVQSACLQLCLDRRLGEYVLPDNVSIIAASNRESDKAGAHRVITPLLNRFMHVDMDVDQEDWQEWAIKHKVRQEIRSFLKFKPKLLFGFDPKANQHAFPTPRSWEFASMALQIAPQNMWRDAVASCVGDGAASEFINYCKVYEDLPKIDDVLKKPESAPIYKDEPSIQFALCEALIDKAVHNGSNKVFTPIVQYMRRINKEFAFMMARAIGKANREFLNNDEFNKWFTDEGNSRFLKVN